LVIVTGANFVAGVTTTFQCAAAVADGQLVIPSFVLLSISPSGNVPMGGFSVVNQTSTAFTASGLDIATIRYGAGFNVTTRYQ
jgi:hypothetical protein